MTPRCLLLTSILTAMLFAGRYTIPVDITCDGQRFFSTYIGSHADLCGGAHDGGYDKLGRYGCHRVTDGDGNPDYFGLNFGGLTLLRHVSTNHGWQAAVGLVRGTMSELCPTSSGAT